MKTVELFESKMGQLGFLSRLSNEIAEKMVRQGKAKYVPKSQWKKEVRSNESNENKS